MKPLRFIHCADLHLDRPFQGLKDIPPSIIERIRESTFQSFHRIVGAAIEQQVDFLVISGDLFDGENRSLRAQARFRNEMERLNAKGIDVFAVHGNHDPLEGQWVPLDLPDNVHIFGPEVEMIPFSKEGETLAHLYGFSYRQKVVNEEKAFDYQKIQGAPYHIGILHGQEESSNSEHAAYAPFSVRKLLEKEFDYWALGHIHKRNLLYEDPIIYYSGNIQGLNPKETGEKGCVLVELNGKTAKHTFLSTAEVIWLNGEISITNIQDAGQLLKACESKLESLRKQNSSVLAVLHLTGSSSVHTYMADEDHIEDLLSALQEEETQRRDFVWPVSIKLDSTPDWDREELKKEGHFIGDLLNLIDHEELEETFADLWENRRAKKHLPEIKDEDEREWLKDAEHLLLAELLGKGERE